MAVEDAAVALLHERGQAFSVLSVTVSAFYRRDAGVVDNTCRGVKNNVDQADTIGGWASILWHAASNTSLRVSALYQKAEWDGSTGNYLLTVIRPRAVGLSLAKDF